MVLQHGQHVLVPRYHPEVERGRVEDRLLAAREREHVERVLPLLGRRRVERDGRVRRHGPTDLAGTVPATRRVIDAARELEGSGGTYGVVDESGQTIGLVDRGILVDVLLESGRGSAGAKG